MLKHLSFLSLKINPNIFGVASYTKMLTLLETCSARRLLDLILRYAPNKVKRGFAPAVCGQLPHSPRARGQAPCTPKIALFVFRLPSLFCGRSSHKIVPLNRPLSAVVTAPTLCICKGFAPFYDVHRPTRRATIWRGVRGLFVDFCL